MAHKTVAGFELRVVPRNGDGDRRLGGECGRQLQIQANVHAKRASKSNGFGGVVRRSGEAQRKNGKRDFRGFARPVEEIWLREIHVHLEWLFDVGWVARFYGGDFAVKAVESENRLGQLFPSRLRSAAKSKAQDEFRVAMQDVMHVRGKFPQAADLAGHFHALR